MRVIDRYLVREFIYPFVYCFFLFLLLFVVVDAFNNLDEFLKHGFSLRVMLTYYLYFLPAIFVQVAPISTLVAVLYNLGHLNRHNEITALKASGISPYQILAPYLFIGLSLSFLVFLVNEKIVPRTRITSTAIRQGLIEQGKKNLDERAIRNVALYGSGNRIIFAREFEILSRTLHDVVIHEHNMDQDLKFRLTAKRAQYENGRWTLTDTAAHRLNRRGDFVGEPVYSKRLELDFGQTPEDFIKTSSQSDFMNARELKAYRDSFKGGIGRNLARRLSVDFHTKVAFPFVSLVVILIGAPLALRIERGSAMVGIGTSLAVVVLYYGIDSICLALGKGGALPPVAAAWSSNLIFSGVGIYLIKRVA